MANDLITVNFHEDTLFAVQQEDGAYVAIKSIAEGLGLDWEGQRQRIRRDTILEEGTCMIKVPSAGGEQDALCMRLDLINGWLFGIDDSRIKDEEVRQKVLVYKRECYRVLFEHFHAKAAARLADGPSPTTFEAQDGLDLDLLERLKMVTETRQAFGRAAAQRLWFSLGLPTVAPMRLFGAHRDDEERADENSEAFEAFLADCTIPLKGARVPIYRMADAFTQWTGGARRMTPREIHFLLRDSGHPVAKVRPSTEKVSGSVNCALDMVLR